jgi:hypothetical protein
MKKEGVCLAFSLFLRFLRILWHRLICKPFFHDEGAKGTGTFAPFIPTPNVFGA